MKSPRASMAPKEVASVQTSATSTAKAEAAKSARVMRFMYILLDDG
jgi:hypothetical protein